MVWLRRGSSCHARPLQPSVHVDAAALLVQRYLGGAAPAQSHANIVSAEGALRRGVGWQQLSAAADMPLCRPGTSPADAVCIATEGRRTACQASCTALLRDRRSHPRKSSACVLSTYGVLEKRLLDSTALLFCQHVHVQVFKSRWSLVDKSGRAVRVNLLSRAMFAPQATTDSRPLCSC